MKGTLPRLLVLIALAAFCCGDTTEAAAIQKQVNGATSGAPVVIAILSDHYTDQNEFDLDVENFITYGLLAHPYYASHKADLQIVSFYEPLAAGTQSNYGFNVEVPSNNCALSWTVSDDATNTATRIESIVGSVNPEHTIVIGDHPYNIGCTDGEWTYVGRDAVGSDVLAHEFGHGLANLYDEWFFESNRGVSHPGIPANQTRNCYDTRHGMPPVWPVVAAAAQYGVAGSFPGCDLYELDVVHAYDHAQMYGGEHYCLMGATHDASFCPVCRSLMEDAFNYLRNPDTENPEETTSGTRVPIPPPNQPANGTRKPVPPPTGVRIVRTAFVQQPAPGTVKPTSPGPPAVEVKPVPPRPIVRLVVSFNPVNGAMRAKKGIPITARYIPSHRRLGDYVYEIVANNQTLDVGVIPSNLFQSHSYQGGAAHGSSPPHTTDITIQIPDVTTEMLKSATFDLTIRVYWLSPNVTQKLITPAVLAQLKTSGQAQQRGEPLNAKAIISVM